ncbi:MAG: hypothetical protein KAY46_23940 [Burkholderiaceae bacterium]|nr:hypothetical protein [Burkholderiaceae bacterium]
MKPRPVIRLLVTFCLVVCGALVGVSRAQSQADADVDPPERVGRLSVIEGDVQAWDEALQAWQPAQLNLPVTSRSAFLSGPGARAEIKVGSAALRLDADSQANLVRLDDGGTDIDLPRGTVGVRLRASGDPPWQIAVGDALVSLASPGSYRVDVDPARGLLVARVFEGRAEIDAAGNRTLLTPGQQFSHDLNSQRPIGQTALVRTPFDDWAARRDREQDRLQAWRYVSPEMTGADSLDAAGDWRTDPAYGPVWYPHTVPAGWAPYSTGRWVWMPPWGWHWVDEAPWGFAPFHYGRWIQVDNVWGWAPGAYVRRPVYAPALVGFHGNGGRVSFAPAFGGSHGARAGVGGQRGPVGGWFPLAPGEAWHPPYRTSGTYLRSLNPGHRPGPALRYSGGAGLPGQPYRYAQVPHASTRFPQEAITGSRSVGSNRLPLPGPIGGVPMRGAGPVQGPAMAPMPGPAMGPGMGLARGYRQGDRGDSDSRVDRIDRIDRIDRGYRGGRSDAGEWRGRGDRIDRDAMIRPPGHVPPQGNPPPAQRAYGTPGRQVFAPPERQSFAAPARQGDAPAVRQPYAVPMQQGPAPSARSHPGRPEHSGGPGGSSYSGAPGRSGGPGMSGHPGHPGGPGGGPRGGGPPR